MSKRCWILLLPLMVFMGTGAGIVIAVGPEKSAGSVEAFLPPDKAVLSSGNFYVICKKGTADLAVDGVARPWGRFAEPLKVARLHLEPGTHQIRLGDHQIEVRVDLEGKGAQPGWEGYRIHPIDGGAKACEQCHQASQQAGQTAVGDFKGPTACLECHKPVEFEAKHSHPLEPLRHCNSCHGVHGSPRKAFLKAPIKKLCAECHEN